MATIFGAWVEACIEPEKKQSMTERQHRAEEEMAKRDEAVERKCAMMLSSQEARGKTAFARVVDQDHTLSTPGTKQKNVHPKKSCRAIGQLPNSFGHFKPGNHNRPIVATTFGAWVEACTE